MILWIGLCFGLALAYGALLWACRKAWASLFFFAPGHAMPQTRVSVLIPARNEAEALPRCLESLSRQTYPPHEVWVVDDHSEDETAAVVRVFQTGHPGFPLHLLQLDENQAGKKAALEAAIAQSSGTLLACTDADCEVPPEWLRLLATAHEQTQAQLIAGPVAFHREQSVFERFQTLDFLGMVGLAAVGIHRKWWRMANGANLAYTRDAFEAIGGFEGHRHLPSGDDMFLAQRIANRFPNGLFFLKNPDAVVLTRPEPHLGGFIAQRVRWGGKSRHFPEFQLTLILGMVWLFCWSLGINALLIIFFIFFSKKTALVLLCALALQCGIKTWADYRWLGPLAEFAKRRELMASANFAWAGLLHVMYIVVVGTLAVFRPRWKWKGRR